MFTLNSIFNRFSIPQALKPALPQTPAPKANEDQIAKKDALVRQALSASSGLNTRANGSFLALNDLKDMVQTLARRLNDKKADGTLNTTDINDSALLLKKLIIDRLTHDKPSDVKGFIEMRPSASPGLELQQAEAVSASYLSLDIRIELQNGTAMQGRAGLLADSIAIHLEYLSYSALTVNYSSHGLTLPAPNIVDTGQYLIGFKNEMTVEIYEKFSRLSTVIWGDPHVDLSDVEGAANGEFSDLKKSDLFTVFSLQDGTKVLFTAPDSGNIRFVDVIKGNERMHAVGGGAASETTAIPGVFFRFTDLTDLKAPLEQADRVMAGGDGNDWYDEHGRLLWGNKATA